MDNTYLHESDRVHELKRLAIKNECFSLFLAPSEARMLQAILEIHKARKVVEIGTLYGYSSYYLSQACDKLYALEIDPKSYEIAKQFHADMGVNNVEIILGDAKKTLIDLQKQGPFDAVFIDADKQGYLDYLEWAIKNLRKGGLVIADNMFLSGATYDTTDPGYGKNSAVILRQFQQRISDKNIFSSTIFPSHDGLAVGILR
ncbi:MAG: methyltransferase [Phycisphaerales bacterium]|nr:methyltransferase [Phycisphaerales bacterium]